MVTNYKNSNLLLPVLLLLASFFCFWKLGDGALHEWDESRNGVNALEMLQNKDYINLYYGGEPDTWNAKPPLLIWSIVASYSIFGFNEFALRFPAAIATFFSFIVIFYIITLYKSKLFAFAVSIALLSVKGIIGVHVGRTGDFDAPFLLFLLLTTYYALRYIDFQDKKGIIISGVFMGLAFYTKGFASLIIVPGIFLYALLTKKLVNILKDVRFWISIGVYFTFAGSWLFLVKHFGLTFTESVYGSKDSFETMWKYDIFKRITEGFGGSIPNNYDFFFSYLDISFNLWNYLFYLSLAVFLYQLFKKENPLLGLTRNSEGKIILFSACIWFTISLFLTFAAEKHHWYMAPALPFLAIFTLAGLEKLTQNSRILTYTLLGVTLFTFSRNLYQINIPKKYPAFFYSSEQELKNAGKIISLNHQRQDYLLFLKLKNQNIKLTNDPQNVLGADANDVIFIHKNDFDFLEDKLGQFNVIGTDGGFKFLKKNHN